MADTYSLTVSDIRQETRDSVVVTFTPRPEDAAAFTYLSGQYLTLLHDHDGDELRRCYSICTAQGDNILRVGVRRIADGVVSRWTNDCLKVGDMVTVLPPAGNFHTAIEPEKEKSYLMFAGGSGITPILSHIKTILDEEPRATICLVYGNRSVATIMFREELEDLKNRHMGRLAVTHILEQDASDIELFTGRLDQDKLRALFSDWINVSGADMAFICGPKPMMKAVLAQLQTEGMERARIKFELFWSPEPVRNYRPPQGERVSAGRSSDLCHVTVHLDGTVRAFTMPKTGQAVVDAALVHKLDVPHSCKAGVCSSCRAKVIEGEVEMIANHALEDYEVAAGFVLTCQSYPLSDKLVIDYDK